VKETLKRLKALLMLDLTGSATIEIMPVDLAKAVGIEIPVEILPSLLKTQTEKLKPHYKLGQIMKYKLLYLPYTLIWKKQL